MIALIKAVRNQLRTDATIMGLMATRVYAGRGPDDAALPYLVFERLSGWPPQYNTADQIEHVPVRVRAFSTSAEAAAETVEAVEKSFRVLKPALDSGTVMLVNKLSDGLELDPDPTNEGDEVWAGIIDLDFLVHRDPTV